MAMAVDSRQQHPFGHMAYEPIRYQQGPHFTNPWGSSAPNSQSQVYATSLPAASAPGDAQRYAAHAPNVSAAYATGPISAPALGAGTLPMDPDLFHQSGLQVSQDGMNVPRPYASAYTSAPTTTGASYTPTSAPQYTPTPYGYQSDRRDSHPSVANVPMAHPMDSQGLRQSGIFDFSRLHNASEEERQSFSEALEASHGMVAMSQTDNTPRPVYGDTNSRASSNGAYGFPTSHSAHSSISSASTYPSYYPSSVSEASADYSSAGESIDMPTSRTLPRLSNLPNGAMPPAPSSMMGQFSSKVSSSSQKKHQCKICDKRFTRPSSLQTHMYSHTGEKPFACEVQGCSRQFSVVSNLRRHRKVHRGEGRDHPSPDDDDE